MDRCLYYLGCCLILMTKLVAKWFCEVQNYLIEKYGYGLSV